MDTAEQTDKHKKLKIGGIALLGLVMFVAVWWSVATVTSSPCKEDWDPAQVDAEIRDNPNEYVGQCFEIEGTVEEISDGAVTVRSDTGGHTYAIVTRDSYPCVMGNIAEGSRVSASAYLFMLPLSRADGTFYVAFDCAIWTTRGGGGAF